MSTGNSSSIPENDPFQVIFIVVTITAGFSVSLCCICGCLGYRAARSRRKLKCPMCKLWVYVKDWKHGDHRQMCSKRNEFFWKNLPEPFDIRCPTCLQYLKLMPKNFGYDFQCDDRDCPFRGGNILNNGHNRISCFICDYDLCDSCVHRRIYVLSKCIRSSSQIPNGLTNLCELNVDVYPIVPTVSATVPNYGIVNQGFSPSVESSSSENPYYGHCILDHPSGVDLPAISQPYLLSTYV